MKKDNFTEAIEYREKMEEGVGWAKTEDFKKIFRYLEESGLKANMPSRDEVDFSGYLKSGKKSAKTNVQVYKSKRPTIEMKMYIEIDASRYSGYKDIEKVFQSWKEKTQKKIEGRFKGVSSVSADISMAAKVDPNPYLSDITIRGDDPVKLIRDARTIIKNTKGTRYEPVTDFGY